MGVFSSASNSWYISTLKAHSSGPYLEANKHMSTSELVI